MLVGVWKREALTDPPLLFIPRARVVMAIGPSITAVQPGLRAGDGAAPASLTSRVLGERQQS